MILNISTRRTALSVSRRWVRTNERFFCFLVYIDTVWFLLDAGLQYTTLCMLFVAWGDLSGSVLFRQTRACADTSIMFENLLLGLVCM